MTAVLRRTAAASIALLVLAACGSGGDNPADAAAPSPQGRTVQADNGTITVPANPQRVATLGNASLPFIDLGGKPVGVTEDRASRLALLPEDQLATYRAATNLGPSGGEVDLEKLASLKPDLILANFPNAEFEQISQQLESIAPTVLFGLGVEWKAQADGYALAGNATASLDRQKADFVAKVATIKETYREVLADTSFVALDRYTSSDPGTYTITDIGCVEIAKSDVGLDLPDSDGNGAIASFEQLGELSKYDVVLYPVDASGNPTEPFAPVVATNAWKALPVVTSGRALGVFCPGNSSYGSVLRYLESLERALATLSTKE